MKQRKPILNHCPTCGSKDVRRRVMDVELGAGQGIASDIEVDVCEYCGEHLYDPAAMRVLEAAMTQPRKKRRSVESKARAAGK